MCLNIVLTWTEIYQIIFENTNETFGKDQVPIGDVGFNAAGGIAFLSKSFIVEGLSKVVKSSVKPQQGWSIVVTKIPWSKFSHCSSTNLHQPD